MIKKNTVLFVLLSFMIPFFMATAVEKGPHEHDGLYFRFMMGAGYAQTSSTNKVNKFQNQEISHFGEFQFGGTILKNTILSVNFPVYFIPLPGGLSLPNSMTGTGAASGVESYIAAMGVGVTHYFMPVNIFISSSFYYSMTGVEYPGVSGDKNNTKGFAVGFSAGKEWWVSKEWGLGVALNFYYSRQNDLTKGLDITPLDVFSVNIAFTATYN